MLVESFIYDDQDKYITLKEFLDQEGMKVHYKNFLCCDVAVALSRLVESKVIRLSASPIAQFQSKINFQYVMNGIKVKWIRIERNKLCFFPEFEVFKEQDIILTLDDIRMFTSGLTLNEDEHDAIVTHLLETTSKALLIRCNESIKVISSFHIRHLVFLITQNLRLQKKFKLFKKKQWFQLRHTRVSWSFFNQLGVQSINYLYG